MKSKPIFIKGIGGLFFCMVLGLFLFLRADKKKSSFQQVTGVITYMGKTTAYSTHNGSSKYRYLEIDNFPKTFELFVGKTAGDFKPQLEKIDQLKMGDTITLFFDENFKTRNDPINRLTYFIDKGQEVIFIKGGWEKYFAYFIFGISLLFMLALVFLKRKGKIS